MTLKANIYCRDCGKKMASRKTGKYNTATGKPAEELQCMNKKCQVGCGNLTGHTRRWIIGDCVNCGLPWWLA